MNYIDLLNRFYDLLQCSQVSNNAQLLYYTLLQINNKCSWSDWFSRTNVSLSGLMGISENAMKRARAELKQLGLIDFVPSKKRGECTQYRILYLTNGYPNGHQSGYPNGCKTDTKPDTQTDSINKHKQKLKQKSVSDDTPEKCALNSLSGEVLEAFRGYMDYRKSIGAAMTDRAVQLAISKLNELAPGNPSVQVAIINQSVLNGWKGLFELKSTGEKSPQKGGKSNTFHNFHQREVDYDALLAARMQQEGTDGGDNQKTV